MAEDLKAQAATALEQRLAAAGIAGVKVDIGWGIGNSKNMYDPKPTESLQINLSGAAVESSPADAEKVKTALYEELKKIDAMRKNVEFDDPAKHIVDLKAKLDEFIAKGANIPKEYLEWRGLNADLAKEQGNWAVEDHAINLGFGDRAVIVGNSSVASSGITFSLNVPETKAEIDQQTGLGDPLRDKVEKNLKERIPEIKAMMVERLKAQKYLGGQVDEAEIKKQVDNLTIEVRDGVVTIVSPEQKAEDDRRKADPKAAPLEAEAAKALAATNILSKLTNDKLGKVLGRSFLHAGETADEIFPLVAGREDMARAISRQLKILKYSEAGRKDPALAKSVDDFLSDNIFQKQNWDERAKLKAKPAPVKDPDPKKASPLGIVLNFTEKKGVVQELLTALAAPPAQEAAPQPAPEQTADAAALAKSGLDLSSMVQPPVPNSSVANLLNQGPKTPMDQANRPEAVAATGRG